MPATDALNEERAPAYALAPKDQLAQYAATGCLNTTFYASSDEQLAKVLELCAEVDAEFITRTAGSVQAKERDDILNVGGFSDQVWDVIAEFTRGKLNANHWIGVIESVRI